MEFTPEEISQIIGSQHLKIIWLEKQNAIAQQRIAELTPNLPAKDNVVQIQEGAG